MLNLIETADVSLYVDMIYCFPVKTMYIFNIYNDHLVMNVNLKCNYALNVVVQSGTCT